MYILTERFSQRDFIPRFVVYLDVLASLCFQGFSNGDQFFSFLKDTFDYLYKEGESLPKMMTIGLHCRLVGRSIRNSFNVNLLLYQVTLVEQEH